MNRPYAPSGRYYPKWDEDGVMVPCIDEKSGEVAMVRLSDEPESKAVQPEYYKSKLAGLDLLDVIAAFQLDFFVANVWKYTLRYKDKNGLQDLLKAREYLDRLIESMDVNSTGGH